MPVPISSVSVAAAAAVHATNGSYVRLYSSGGFAAARVRRLATGGDVGVLGEQQGLEPALLRHRRELGRVLHVLRVRESATPNFMVRSPYPQGAKR